MNYRFLIAGLGLLISPLIPSFLCAMEPLVSQQDKLPSLSNSELIQGIKELPRELRLYIISLLIQHRLGLNFSLARNVNVGSSVSAVTVSPDGKTFYTSSIDGIIRVWDRATGNQLQQFNGRGLVKFSSTGNALLISYNNKTVVLWDIAAHQELHRLYHEDTIKQVEFSPDGKTFLTMSKDEIRLWDAETGCFLNSFCPTRSYLKSLFSGDSYFSSVAYNHDGKGIITGSHNYTDNKEICLIDLATGCLIHSFQVKTLSSDFPINNLICSKDGKFVFASTRNELFLLDTQIKEQRKLVNKQECSYYRYIALSSDGILATSPLQFYEFSSWDVKGEGALSICRMKDAPFYWPRHADKLLLDSVFRPDLEFTPDGKSLIAIRQDVDGIVSIVNKDTKELSSFPEELKKDVYNLFLDYYPLVAGSCLSLECSAEDGHCNNTVSVGSIAEKRRSSDCLIQ